MAKIEYYGLIGKNEDGTAAVYWFRNKEIVDKLIHQSMFSITEKIIVMTCPDYRDIESELGIEFADSSWEVFMDSPPEKEERIEPEEKTYSEREKEIHAFAQALADSIDFWGADCSG